MKGFILCAKSFEGSKILDGFSVPGYIEQNLHRLDIVSFLSFIGWGFPQGDIYYSRNMDFSFFPLNW